MTEHLVPTPPPWIGHAAIGLGQNALPVRTVRELARRAQTGAKRTAQRQAEQGDESAGESSGQGRRAWIAQAASSSGGRMQANPARDRVAPVQARIPSHGHAAEVPAQACCSITALRSGDGEWGVFFSRRAPTSPARLACASGCRARSAARRRPRRHRRRGSTLRSVAAVIAATPTTTCLGAASRPPPPMP